MADGRNRLRCATTAAAVLLALVACRAAAGSAPPAAVSERDRPRVEIAALCRRAETLVGELEWFESRIEARCALIYLEHRDDPAAARRLFREILSTIDATPDEDDPAFAETLTETIDRKSERLNVVPWMLRCGLRADARRLFETVTAAYDAEIADGGDPFHWFRERAVRFYARDGDDAAALRYIDDIALFNADGTPIVEQVGNRPVEIMRTRVVELLLVLAEGQYETGRRTASARTVDEAWRVFEPRPEFHSNECRRLVVALLRHHREADARRLLAGFEKAQLDEESSWNWMSHPTPEYLVPWLVEQGRAAEARRELVRLERRHVAFRPCIAGGYAVLGDVDEAVRCIEQMQLPRNEYFDGSADDYREMRSMYWEVLRRDALRSGKLAAADRFHALYRRDWRPDDWNPDYYDDDDRKSQARSAANCEAVFAMLRGDASALVRYADGIRDDDRYVAEERLRCYLATAFHAQGGPLRRPFNPYLPYVFGGDRE